MFLVLNAIDILRGMFFPLPNSVCCCSPKIKSTKELLQVSVLKLTIDRVDSTSKCNYVCKFK